MAKTNPPFMTGVPELLVLRLLAREEMYGYQLVKAVRLVTDEAIALGEGVIYPVLHGLEEAGFVRTKRRAVGGRTRVYYKLTAKGRSRKDKLTMEWQRISTAVDTALGAPANA